MAVLPRLPADGGAVCGGRRAHRQSPVRVALVDGGAADGADAAAPHRPHRRQHLRERLSPARAHLCHRPGGRGPLPPRPHAPLAVALALLGVPGAPDDRRVVRDLDDGRRRRSRRGRRARAGAWSSAPRCSGAVAAVLVVASGALAERLAVMDAPWLAAFDSRDYLFPLDDWKIGTWLTHLLPSLVIVAVWQWRRRLGVDHAARARGGPWHAWRCCSGSWRPCRSSTRGSRWPSSCRPRACSGSSSCWRRPTSCGRSPNRRGCDAGGPARHGPGGAACGHRASRAATTSCASSTITGWSPCTCRIGLAADGRLDCLEHGAAGACAGRPRPCVERRRQPARDRQA